MSFNYDVNCSEAICIGGQTLSPTRNKSLSAHDKESYYKQDHALCRLSYEKIVHFLHAGIQALKCAVTVKPLSTISL